MSRPLCSVWGLWAFQTIPGLLVTCVAPRAVVSWRCGPGNPCRLALQYRKPKSIAYRGLLPREKKRRYENFLQVDQHSLVLATHLLGFLGLGCWAKGRWRRRSPLPPVGPRFGRASSILAIRRSHPRTAPSARPRRVFSGSTDARAGLLLPLRPATPASAPLGLRALGGLSFPQVPLSRAAGRLFLRPRRSQAACPLGGADILLLPNVSVMKINLLRLYRFFFFSNEN